MAASAVCSRPRAGRWISASRLRRMRCMPRWPILVLMGAVPGADRTQWIAVRECLALSAENRSDTPGALHLAVESPDVWGFGRVAADEDGHRWFRSEVSR